MDNTVYHERVNRLFENVRRLRLSMQKFAEERGITQSAQPAMAGVGANVDTFVEITHEPVTPIVSQSAPVMPQAPAPSAAAIANEINIDDILNSVDLSVTMP